MRTFPLLARLAVAVALSGAALGCAPKIEPEIASPSNEAIYATQYPAELQHQMDAINDAETKSKELDGKLSAIPDTLKSPKWANVLDVVDLADAEGRAYAYVEARREHDAAQTFFDAEKDEINKKVAGAAYAAAKQGNCNADASGAVQHALKEAIEKRLEIRLREHSEAHAYIDRNVTALGKDNVDKLADAADLIAQASYVAHVEVVEAKVRMRRMLEEAENIKKTLDAAIRAEQVYQAETGRTAAEKKSSEERVEAAKKAQGNVDAAVTQAKQVSERADERVAAITKSYDDAIAKLRADLKKRGGS